MDLDDGLDVGEARLPRVASIAADPIDGAGSRIGATDVPPCMISLAGPSRAGHAAVEEHWLFPGRNPPACPECRNTSRPRGDQFRVDMLSGMTLVLEGVVAKFQKHVFGGRQATKHMMTRPCNSNSIFSQTPVSR
jgi:hypothetical protein